MDMLYQWGIPAAFVVGVLLKLIFWGSGDRSAVRQDLEERGCRLLHLRWLPFRRGLLVKLDEYDPAVNHRRTVFGSVYRVTYQNGKGETLEAVCEMGPDRSVHWTDEHREPGYDRMGNPPNLSMYGSEWRG